jgi:glycosyltransferase involved in cell wall biosynthesis
VIDELESLAGGGTERQIFQLAQMAKANGTDVHLAILRQTAWLTPEIAGVPVHFLNIRSWRRFPVTRLPKMLGFLGGFDVVQTFFVESNLIIPILARLAGVPRIIGSRRNLNYWIGSHTLRLQRFSNRFAHLLVANSEAVKRAVAEQERVSADRIEVIYNAIDAERFAPNPGSRVRLRQVLGVAEDDVVVGQVSTLGHHKGVDRFVDVGIMLAQRHPRARFVLIGGGPLHETLRSKIAGASMTDRIILLGSRDDVPGLLDALDMAVLLSDTEGFSNSLLEYMAKGLAIVATDVGGNAEALQGCGVLVPTQPIQPIADQIERLLSDPRTRREMGEKARARAVATYGLTAIQAQWSGLYAGEGRERKSVSRA